MFFQIVVTHFSNMFFSPFRNHYSKILFMIFCYLFTSFKLVNCVLLYVYIVIYYFFSLSWEGEGVNEVGKNKTTGDILVRVNPKFYRPTEVVSTVCIPTSNMVVSCVSLTEVSSLLTSVLGALNWVSWVANTFDWKELDCSVQVLAF